MVLLPRGSQKSAARTDGHPGCPSPGKLGHWRMLRTQERCRRQPGYHLLFYLPGAGWREAEELGAGFQLPLAGSAALRARFARPAASQRVAARPAPGPSPAPASGPASPPRPPGAPPAGDPRLGARSCPPRGAETSSWVLSRLLRAPSPREGAQPCTTGWGRHRAGKVAGFWERSPGGAMGSPQSAKALGDASRGAGCQWTGKGKGVGGIRLVGR